MSESNSRGETDSRETVVPRHVAIIMDGNNRWAKRQGKTGIFGHKAGVERIRDVLAACRQRDVEVLTVFAFSSENWKRPPKEVEALLGLFYNYLKKEAKKLAADGVRLKVIGSRERFNNRLKAAIEEAEAPVGRQKLRLLFLRGFSTVTL